MARAVSIGCASATKLRYGRRAQLQFRQVRGRHSGCRLRVAGRVQQGGGGVEVEVEAGVEGRRSQAMCDVRASRQCEGPWPHADVGIRVQGRTGKLHASEPAHDTGGGGGGGSLLAVRSRQQAQSTAASSDELHTEALTSA
jgi:hypothetical protein